MIGFLALAVPARAVDLFEALALGEIPDALQKPEWAASATRRIGMAWTAEEMYREWRGDREISRFDGSRTKLWVEEAIAGRWGVRYETLVRGRQIWMTEDVDRADRFELGTKEKHDALSLRHVGKGWALEAGGWSSQSTFRGAYELHPDIVAALGSSPGINFDNPSSGRWYRMYSRGSDVDVSLDLRDAGIEHDLRTTGIRMALQVPLHRRSREFTTRVALTGNREWRPYLQWSQVKDHGNGVSMKDGRFEFGETVHSMRLTGRVLGVAHEGRKNWFAEAGRYRLDSTIYIKNNLITLDPLFLFSTNEIQTLDTIPDVAFWGGRVGHTFHLFSRISADAQYGLMRIPLQVIHHQTKISNLRTDREETTEIRDSRYDLHRLELNLRRPDRRGAWKTKLRLLVPAERKKPEKEETAGAAPPGPSAPPAAEPEKHIRGGWQFTLEREFFL
ncbi:hypothetical protein KBA41_02000 [Candidatus Ozemobacteraceae bacterium]|nr:hypothetical protein [Candidatus Ozemobacteraceae bacterium]